MLFDKSQTTLVAFPAGREGTYTIPNTIIDIEDLSACNKLNTVQFSRGLSRTADGALAGCNGLRRQVDFQSSLVRIGYASFSNCGALTALSFRRP